MSWITRFFIFILFSTSNAQILSDYGIKIGMVSSKHEMDRKNYTEDYGETRTYDLDKGIIKIQDWNIDSQISGRVLSTPWNNNNYSFWYKFD